VEANLPSLTCGELSIVPTREDKALQLVWSGRSTSRDPRGTLVPYFEQAFAAAERDAVALELRLAPLSLCNSATIAAIVDAIRIGRERSVPMTIVYDGSQRWQRVSFDPLRMFSSKQALEVRAA
jgi:hypothetical protein